MINASEILYELSDNKNVFDPDFDLIKSNVLDSYNFIELLSILEDKGITLYPTRINKELLRTPRGIEQLIKENSNN